MRKMAVLLVLAAIMAAGCGKKESAQELADGALAAAEAGNWKQCSELCGRALALSPSSSDLLALNSIALYRQGMAGESQAAARRAVELSPNSFAGHYMLGFLAMTGGGDTRRAIDEFSQTMMIAPGDPRVLMMMGEACGQVSDSRALTALQMLGDRNFYTPAVQSRLGIIYAMAGDLNRARDSFTTARELPGDNPIPVLNLARFLDFYGGDPAGAARYYREFLKITAGKTEYSRPRLLAEGRLAALNR